MYLCMYFTRFDGGTDFYIHMVLELNQQLLIVGNYMLIGKAVFIFLNSVSIIRPCIFRIAIIIHPCLFTKELWKVFFTSAILQAPFWSTRSMKHEMCNCYRNTLDGREL